MSSVATARTITREIEALLARVDQETVTRIDAALGRARRVFVCGEGRSGLVMRMFAVRLLHLGMTVHVVGETTAPPIQPGDLLVLCSGSGRTAIPVLVATRALEAGAELLLFTADAAGPLVDIARTVVLLPAPPKGNRTGAESVQYEGSLFEQTVLLLCDACFETLRSRRALETGDLRAAHANLE